MTTRIHPISLPFQLPINAEISVDRLVHAYIVVGEQLCVVDTGVAASHQTIVDALTELGESPSDVDWIVNTHAHPDHAGGNYRFQQEVGPNFACHIKAARWIEDMDLQFKERREKRTGLPEQYDPPIEPQPLKVNGTRGSRNALDFKHATLRVEEDFVMQSDTEVERVRSVAGERHVHDKVLELERALGRSVCGAVFVRMEMVTGASYTYL